MSHKLHRRGTRMATTLVAALVGPVLVMSPTAAFSSEEVILTATTQDIPSPDPDLSVTFAGKTISALPVRLRILNEASPLGYSLDLRRAVSYGDSWTAVSLGRPSNPEDRSLSKVGVANSLIAQAIALEPLPSGANSEPSPLEYAARQVAIWSETNDLPLTSQTVSSRRLLQRALELRAGISQIRNVPLQAAHHSVHVFVRETTANTVRLGVVIALDPNTHLSTPQDIDLYLDGVRCPIRTRALTHVEKTPDGTYRADQPTTLPSATHSNDIAEVDLDRNTKVVDATANWVNVRSDAGLVLVSQGAAPPMLTAETSVLNFSTTTALDPDQYTNPGQLLSKEGTAILTELPQWLVWVVLLLALYLLPRAGRFADASVNRAWRKIRQTSDVETVATPSEITAEAPSVAGAIAAGMATMKSATPLEVDIAVLQTPRASGLFRRSRRAQVRLRVHPSAKR